MTRLDGFKWAVKQREKGKAKVKKGKKSMFKQDIAVIVTDYRTGGTFLSLALDSHPRIYCHRDEPLAKSSAFYRHMVNPDPVRMLKIVFDQGLADVCMCKLVYRQVRTQVLDFLCAARPKVIHLIRENTLRATFSLYFHHQVRQGNASSKGRGLRMWTAADDRKYSPDPIRVNVSELLSQCQARDDNKARWTKRLTGLGFDTMAVTYEELVGGEGKEAGCIPQALTGTLCQFLGVGMSALCSESRKVNAYPLSRLVSNWIEVERAIRKSDWAKFLEEERQYE